jgi:DNA-binding SARP family transcriptional activator/TolB-like protein
VEASVEIRVESNLETRNRLEIRTLGGLTVLRDGVAQMLPKSRKVQAVFACLALASQPVPRSQLCDLLWDAASDPRGELRWCLSKIRGFGSAVTVLSEADKVGLIFADSILDAAAIARAEADGIASLDPQRLHRLLDLFRGEFMAGLVLDRSPNFTLWLAAQRRRFEALHLETLNALLAQMPDGSEPALALIERRAGAAPLEAAAQLGLLAALARRGRIDAAQAHFEATARLFQSEGLDVTPLRSGWNGMRQGHTPSHPNSVAAGMVPAAVASGARRIEPMARSASRASLAVMPFTPIGFSPLGVGLADGLTHDVISRLAKLRSFFVIAQGSVFALAERGVGPDRAGSMLAVDYVAGGQIRQRAGGAIIEVTLSEARTGRVLWADTLDFAGDDLFGVMEGIGDKIVAAISLEIEIAERNRAILRPPNSLDAWGAYHRGLWHMYRFTREDNLVAQHFFERSVAQDPSFARAHAGLSFTHWQSAFQRWADEAEETGKAYDYAGQSLMADEHDPTAHWAMGRALWLRGEHEFALDELRQTVELSPNFALGHYALAFVQSQSGDPDAAIGASDHSRQLSPYDPLLFGMLGARAMALVRLGRFEEAADWALKAAAQPNAHVIILAIAAHCLALAGRSEAAQTYATAVRRVRPEFGVEEFLAAFRFSRDAEVLFRKGAKAIGFKH